MISAPNCEKSEPKKGPSAKAERDRLFVSKVRATKRMALPGGALRLNQARFFGQVPQLLGQAELRAHFAQFRTPRGRLETVLLSQDFEANKNWDNLLKKNSQDFFHGLPQI